MRDGLPEEVFYERVAALPAGSLRPAYRDQLEDAFAHWFDARAPLQPWRERVLNRVVDAGEAYLAGCPAMGEVALALLAPDNDAAVRRIACILLTHFPTVDTVGALSRVVLDDGEPEDLRAQAAWTLGFRQAQERHPDLCWPADAIALADRTLREGFERGLDGTLRDYAEACRHVADLGLHDAIAGDPARASAAVDAFASPTLARALLGNLSAIPTARTARMIRLIAATLGDEAVAPLLEYAADATVAEKVEALFAAYTIDRDAAAPALGAFIDSLKFPGDVQARRAFHDARPGKHAVVEALRVARTTACIAPADRAARCAQAFLQMRDAHAGHALVGEELLDFYVHLAFGARAEVPDALADAVAARPALLEKRPQLLVPYLDALAARGQMTRLSEDGARLGAADEAAFRLAQRGRPFLALKTRLATRRDTPAAVAAEVLGLFGAGRPDLAMRSLSSVTPEAEPIFGSWVAQRFPGADEQWVLGQETTVEARRMRALIDKDLGALMALSSPPPPTADPDRFDLSLLSAFEGPRGSSLTGAKVLLVGRFADEAGLRARLTSMGATVVDAPFGGTDRFVVGEDPDRDVLYRLWQLGARPVSLEET